MLYILLPAFNEEKDIAALLERIQLAMETSHLDYEILVVNDGSRDGTVSVVNSYADRMPILLLDHGVNKGLGQAMLTGFTKAIELAGQDEIIIAMDADNTHDPGLIPAMVQKIQSGKDIVIASRYEKGGEEIGLAYYRHILSKGVNTGLRVIFPISGAKDYSCGYRAYKASLIKQAFDVYGGSFVEERGFTCMVEILLKLSRLSNRVAEVPLTLRYDYKSGASKMNVLRTIRRYFVLVWRQKFQPLKRNQNIPSSEINLG